MRKVRKWTAEEDERVIMMWRNGESASYIALELGNRSRNSVISRMDRLRVKTPASPHFDEKETSVEILDRVRAARAEQSRKNGAKSKGGKRKSYTLHISKEEFKRRCKEAAALRRVDRWRPSPEACHRGGVSRAEALAAIERRVYHPLRDNPRLLSILERC